MTIKAIETFYKNYHFRSRLEARWAVFFDALGLEWEYEPEGFDLGGGVYYLPDFYLPASNMWVEIKPSLVMETESVYLAGKIRKNCWRHRIAHIEGASFNLDWSPVRSYYNHIEVTGPFFEDSWGHGLAHGSASHGQNGAIAKDWGRCVHTACCNAIDGSSGFFAWIDSLDCYGTLIEAGYAAARGKKIHVAVDAKLQAGLIASGSGGHELWFLEKTATSFGFFNDPVAAFESFYPTNGNWVDWDKIYKVAHNHNGIAVIVGGDPMDSHRYGHREAIEITGTWCLDGNATRAARSARFEHGQKGALL